MRANWLALVAAGGLGLGSPVLAAEKKPAVIVPPPVQPMSLPPAAKPRPVSLTRLVANLPASKTWATVGENPLCVTEYTLQWDVKYNRLEGDTELKRGFREAVASAGFAVAGDPTDLFSESQASDLQIGALVSDVRGRFCSFLSGEPYKGAVAMDIEWQVYSVSQGRVLARIKTQGGFEIRKAAKDAIPRLLTGAFSDNAARLAADGSFRSIVFAAEVAPTPTRQALVFATPMPGPVPLASAVKSVVSIFAGESLGSGVLISSDGYVLTNHHVAGSTDRVRVRWADGSETVGEVLRSDVRRDVALIRTSPRANALPIRGAPALLGEPVIAVGTPLDKEFAGTLTRGIVSSHRVLEGQPWIQSDVSVTHGNSGGPLLDASGQILGLTSWGRVENGAATSLNFFIPIDDALRVLAISPTLTAGPPTVASRK